MPRVSVVVSHYDRQALLLEALGSIAAQTYSDFEVIVVNDHGADSRVLVDDFAARMASEERPCPVRYEYRPVNGGVAATRNRGVALATGELIAYLDDDDLWHPDLLKRLVGMLDARPDSGLAYGDAEIWRMASRSVDVGRGRDEQDGRPAEVRTLAVPFDLDELRRDDFIVPGAMVHRRSLYDAVGPFDETLYVSDDWDWLLRAAAVTTFARVPETVITVRIWPDQGNLSANVGARRMAALAEIERRHATPPLEPKTFWEVAGKHVGRDLSSPGLADSGSMPNGRPSPAPLLELATGFERSKVLFALIQLEIPTLLAEGPRPPVFIAAAMGADTLATVRLLGACVELGLLVRVGDHFSNTPLAQEFLVRGAPSYLGDALRRYDRVSYSEAWAQFARRLSAWRRGESALSWEGAPVGDEVTGQHRLALLAGEALARSLDLSPHRRLLDLGGGTGAMSIALCQRYSELTAVVLELPTMADVAREFVRSSGLDGRIEVCEGSFLERPLPGGCDAVLLANVLSMLSAETTRSLLDRIFEHLPAGGIVVLSGWMLRDDDSGPLLPMLLCLEDILLGAPEVERSGSTYASWLADAGFENIDRGVYFEPVSYVIGHKPRDRR